MGDQNTLPPLHLGEKKVYRAGSEQSLRFEGDYTFIDLGETKSHYKLADAYARVRDLKFTIETQKKLQSFADYAKTREIFPLARFITEVKPRPTYPADEAYRNLKQPFLYPRGDMLILIDSAIYTQVAARIRQYVLDVGRDGYWATVHVITGGTPAQIADYIHKRNPVGALLVGAIAVPWFEMPDDFDNIPSEFPCDLYYMDTNGTWNDPDGDGKFSEHTGDVDAEIWIGRLYTPTNSGRDTTLINDYFDRNHQFRLGCLGQSCSGLAYVDDDWADFGDCALDEQFAPANITCYNAPVQTDSDLYKAEVNTLRSWIQLCAHSSPHSHRFTVGNDYEYIDDVYFRDTNPPNAHFYNLFCCGPGRFTEADYLAGWYLFDKGGGGRNNALAVIASSKSGSMLQFEDFYRPLGKGYDIGDAFVQWWQARGGTHDLGIRRWFYGLVLLGDPTMTWFKGVVPQLIQPQPEDVFTHWPRQMQFRWNPVEIPGAQYTVEVDAFGAIAANKWAEEVNQTFGVYNNIPNTSLDHTFVGAQRGRWRVKAVVGGQACAWSPWSYFKFTV